MPKNDETNASGQAGQCGCIGCRMNRLVYDYSEEVKNDPTIDMVDSIVNGISSLIGNMVAGSSQRDARTITDEIVKRAKIAKRIFEASDDRRSATHH